MDAFDYSQLDDFNLTNLYNEPGRSHEQAKSNDTEASTHPSQLCLHTVPFGPTFQAAGKLPDVMIVTADRTRFHTHIRHLHHASANSWGGLLTSAPQTGTIGVPEDTRTITIVLYVIYGLPCLHLVPTLETIESALVALIKYGVAIHKIDGPNMPLYQLVLTQAPRRPIETYALAAHYDLEHLAVAISAHLLAFDMSTLSDDLTVKMGAVYFMRLFDLHQTRRAALKAIVLKPPALHTPTAMCGKEAQRELTKAWALGAAEMAWDLLPSEHSDYISTYALQSAFEKAGKSLVCNECREMLQRRIQEATFEWSTVRMTI